MLRLVSIRVLAFSMVLAGTPAWAQITSTIHGVVRDEGGAVLPGAAVSAANEALGRVEATQVTDTQGRYRLAGLRPGAYTITVQLDGFATATLTNVILQIDSDVALDVMLLLAGHEETVTVIGEAPLTRPADSDLQQLIATRAIENMPLNGREFLDLMGLVPGTSSRPQDSDQGANVTVFGERSISNSFLVDGLDNNDLFNRDFSEFFIQDAIQEFKVLLGGYQAEFGRASGAVANVITRSGSNELKGRAFFFSRHDALDASNISGQDPQQLTRHNVGGTLGGPIVRGRTFFFEAFEFFREKRGLNFDQSVLPPIVRDGYFSPSVGTEPFDRSPIESRYNNFLKIDHQFNASNKLFASLNVNRGSTVDFVPSPNRGFSAPPPGTLVLPSIASDLRENSTGLNSRHTLFLGPNTFLESSIRAARLVYQENVDKPRGAEQLFPLTFTPDFRVWMTNASPIAVVDRTQDRFQWKEDLSFFFRSTDRWGSHAIKVGIDLDRTSLNHQFLPTQSIIHGNTALDTRYRELGFHLSMQRNQFEIVSPNERARASTNNWGFYAQDSWTAAPGLTLNLGLRYDYASLFGADKNNLAPRLGLAYDVGGKARTVLRSSWGRFYDMTILEAVVETPELGGVQFATGRMQVIPRGGSFFNNPALDAFGPLQAGGTRWLANPAFYSYIMPAGTVFTSGAITTTARGEPYIVYDLLGIPVPDPANPPVLTFDSIPTLTGGRLTPEQALDILNGFFPGPGGRPQFTFLAETGANSINAGRPLAFIFSFLEVNARQSIQQPPRTPYTDSFNVGIEQALGNDFAIDVQLFIRRSRDLLARRVVNLLDVPVGADCKANTVDGSPCDRQLQYIGFLDSNVLAVTLEKRFSRNHAFMASYSVTDATDNFSTLRVPPTAGETSFLFNNRPELDIGRSLNTPRHVFVLNGIYQLPYDVTVASIIRSTSGRPFNAAGLPEDSDGDEQFDNRLIGTEKGEFETNPFFQLDLRIAKDLNFSGRRRTTLIAEFFNLTNRSNPFIVNTVFGPEIGRTIQPFPGREVQLGLRFDF